MQNPAKEIDIRSVQRLLGEEVVRHEVHPSLQLSRQHLAPLLRRPGQVLHDDLEVTRCGRQNLRDASLASAHVDENGARAVERGPVVACKEMFEIPALAFGEEAHAGAEASRALGVLGQEGVDVQGGLVLDVEARFRRLFRIRVLPQRLDGFSRAWGEFGGHEADRVQGFRVLDEEARRGGVDDVVWGGFGEDMVGYGVVKEAPNEGLGKGCFLGEVGEGDGRILRDIGSEVVGVDGAE